MNLLGVHLPRSQVIIFSAVKLKCVGFSFIRSRVIVVSKEELDSVSNEGPVSSIDISIDWMVSETAVKGTIASFNRTSIKWHAVRDNEGDVTALEALCQTDTQ